MITTDLAELIEALQDSLSKNLKEWTVTESRLTHMKTGVSLWLASGRLFFSVSYKKKTGWREDVKIPYFGGGKLWKLAHHIWKGNQPIITDTRVTDILYIFKNKK